MASSIRQDVKPGMEYVSCDLCQSKETDVVLRQRDLLLKVTDEEFTIVRCRHCRLVYLNPRPTQAQIGTYYPTVYYPPVTGKERSSGQQATRLSGRIKRWVLEEYYGYPSSSPTGIGRASRRLLLWPEKAIRQVKGRQPLPWRGQGRVLDVGCGAGGNLLTLESQGWKVSGIEISPLAAAHARELVNGLIHTGTLETAPFTAGSFDLIFMSHSLEHLPSPIDALIRVHRLLTDDGLVVVTVPNEKSLEARLFGRWWFHWDPPRHFYHFNRHTLSRALKQAGFDPVSMRTGVGSTFFVASLERCWKAHHGTDLPLKKLLDRLLFRPLCLSVGHAGYGTELTIYATKTRR